MYTILKLESEAHWKEGLKILKELRPDLNQEIVMSDKASLQSRGYVFYGLFEENQIVCVSGVIIHPHSTRSKDFWVHDLATTSNVRSRGYGEAMMRFLETEAVKLGCTRLSVHTRLINERAQNFYENHLGYDRYAVVFQKQLGIN